MQWAKKRFELVADSFKEQSVNRRILNAICTVGLWTFLAKSISVVKEITVASTFGTGNFVDAFFVAFLLPFFAINVISGSFGAAFIPAFIRVLSLQGKDAAQRLLSTSLLLAFSLLIIVVIIFAACADLILPLIASGFSPEKLNVTKKLFFILLPVLVFSGISSIWSGILNAAEKFTFTSLTPAITPCFALLGTLMAEGKEDIYPLALGTVIGSVIEAVLLGIRIRQRGYKLLPRWYGADENMLSIARQYVPMFAGALLLSCTTLVDQSMAAMSGSGSVAALNYGGRIVSFSLGIGSLALSTAIFPYFARLVAIKDWSALQHTFKTYTRLILIITIPLAAMLVLVSKQIVMLLYERGNFTAEDTALVARIQSCYALQIPFYLLGILAVRLVSSLQANHLLMWGAVISLSLNIGLNFLFIPRFGVAGIGLSTSIVYFASFCFLAFVIKRRMSELLRSNG